VVGTYSGGREDYYTAITELETPWFYHFINITQYIECPKCYLYDVLLTNYLYCVGLIS